VADGTVSAVFTNVAVDNRRSLPESIQGVFFCYLQRHF